MQSGTERRGASAMRTLRMAALCGTAAALLAQAATAADAGRGRALYEAHGCYTCHGWQGQGTFAQQQTSLMPAPPVLARGVAPFLVSEEVFRAFLRLRAGQNPPDASVHMPHYPASTLDDAAVADLYAHVLTFRADAPALEDIPLMRQMLESAGGD